jgi:hypothetical protein
LYPLSRRGPDLAQGEKLTSRQKRTGVLTVKVPSPVTALAVFGIAFFVYAAGFYAYGVALGWLPRHPQWRTILFVVSVVGALIGAFVLLRLLRWVLQARAASEPGGIDLTVLPAGQEAGDASAAQIAAEMRNALTDVYLSGPSLVPGESARQDFLTDVRGVVERARTPWGALIAAISLLSPRNSYHVVCTEQVDPNRAAYGLTIEVSGLPGHEGSVATIWDDAWPRVVRRAACHIAAYVLPRTKLSRKPPWTPWHGIEIQPDLFFNFHEARRLARSGRLEEALHHFEAAIAQDPLNPYIRLERATVQDQLGLWIDALSSYVDVVTVESWYDRPVWKRYRRIFDDLATGPPGRFVASPNGRAALQIARYRTVASLASGHRLAIQWGNNIRTDAGQPDARQTVRQADAETVIRRLRPLLYKYADLMMRAHQVTDEKPRHAIRELLRVNDQQMLRRVFQFAALEEAAAIERDYRWYHRRRQAGPPVKQAAIHIFPIWSAIQYHYVEQVHWQQGTSCFFDISPTLPWLRRGGPRWLGPKYHRISWLKRIDKALGWLRKRSDQAGCPLPPDPDGVSRLVVKAVGRRIRRPGSRAERSRYPARRGWQEHYNAACTFAVSMLTPELTDVAEDDDASDRHTKLVRSAVDALSRAVVATDSQFAAGHSVWLRRGDQDLDDLRFMPEYRAFIERYLPDASSASSLPSNPTPLVVSAHIVQIVREYGKLRASFWRHQAGQLVIASAELETEPGWWELLQEVCSDYRDWRTRWRLISRATAFAQQLNRFDQGLFSMDPERGWDHQDAAARLAAADDDITHFTAAARILSPVGNTATDPAAKAVKNRASKWLELSEELQGDSKQVIAARNKVLDELGEWVATSALAGQTTRDAFRNAVRGPLAAIGPLLAAELASIWDDVAELTPQDSRADRVFAGPDLTGLKRIVLRLQDPQGVQAPSAAGRAPWIDNLLRWWSSPRES